MPMRFALLAVFLSTLPLGAAQFDVIIRNGTVYDGSGTAPSREDVGIVGDRIAAIGNLKGESAAKEINAEGRAVAPGFINMLSWAVDSLMQDGKSQSDLRQGVTLEVFGEGSSMGPWNEAMKKEAVEQQGDIKYAIRWTTLGEYLEHLEHRGISCNVASFVGATTVRIHELGYADRPPSAAELERMKNLVRQAMREGALGVGSSLIYAPAFYAHTDELIELCKAAAEFNGMYISHIRSEGNRLYEAADELIRISREAGVPAEFYHLKAAGKSNWPKLDGLLEKIEAARADGLKITADMYTYIAAGTGLDASMPPWVQEGGLNEWIKRLQDPAIRARVKEEMHTPTDAWENFFVAAGSPENIVLVGFKNPRLKPLTGKTLAQVARDRGESPEETAMDLVIEDKGRIDTIYFLMSEDNVRRQLKKDWISFGSDEASLAPEQPFLKANPHPRAYGNVARLLGKYVREEKILSLEQAIRRLSALPAENLKLKDRGYLRTNYFADVVVFDPDKIIDHATFEKPHQYATGMEEVFVNGIQVLKDGEHTGATPGRVVRGPGWVGATTPHFLTQAHAHNDYEHKRPLLDALDHHFCSVEADIHLVNGELWVAHSTNRLAAGRTLESLYLEPLRNSAKTNGGRIYPHGPEFTLLIDIKGDWRQTYPVLRKTLQKYQDIITTFRDGAKNTNAVTAIITGNRSLEMFEGEKVRYAAFDGDLGQLDSTAPADLIPWISLEWSRSFHWTGNGEMPAAERDYLQTILNKAHARHRLVRFWGAPDNPIFWREALKQGIDWINTDHLAECEQFFAQRPGPGKIAGSNPR